MHNRKHDDSSTKLLHTSTSLTAILRVNNRNSNPTIHNKTYCHTLMPNG